MEQYEVGQILYMASSKSFKIIPIQVVEEVIRTTIDGVQKTYMVSFPDKEKTIVDIAKISGSLFKNVKEVEAHLLDNTKQAIKQLIKEADAIKNNAFGASVLPTVETLESADQVVQQDDKDVILKVDLGNGQVGRLSKKELQKTGK